VNTFNVFWYADLALRRVDSVNVCSKHSPLKVPLAIIIDLSVLSSMVELKLILTFRTRLNTRSHESLLCGMHSKFSIKKSHNVVSQ
jgi:hypothetical protein